MKVLVTGATGLIGRRLVARLAAEGDQVRALVLPGEEVGPLTGAEIIRGDVTDPLAVRRAVGAARLVYHLAAIVVDWGAEADFVAVNLEGTRNLLDAAVAAGCQRVVAVSSIVVYGSQMTRMVCDESRPREYGVGPYSRTKRAAEELALDYHAFGRVPVTVVRPANVYGPGSGLWVDELIAALRKRQAPLIGSGSGDAMLAYVDNVVDLIVRAATTPAAAGRIYNASDGGGVSWGQYLGDLAEIAGTPPPRFSIPAGAALALGVAMERTARALRRRHRPLLTREAATLLASRHPIPINRAVAELGYRPQVSYDQAMARIAAYVKGGTQ